jgi:hypothetical protein
MASSKEALRVLTLIKHHSQCGRHVNDLVLVHVEKILAAIKAAVAITVLQLQIYVRSVIPAGRCLTGSYDGSEPGLACADLVTCSLGLD